MTRLVDEILTGALKNTESWRVMEDQIRPAAGTSE
jgi:hypothetical protein